MKTIKKILIIICIIIIAVGVFILVKNGLNYAKGYTQSKLIETAKQYILPLTISTGIILIYLTIRYHKQGIFKVLITSILGIIGAMAFGIAVIIISMMPVSRIVFPIMLTVYVSSILALSANFETKKIIHIIKNP